jgi:hypothetical protein
MTKSMRIAQMRYCVKILSVVMKVKYADGDISCYTRTRSETKFAHKLSIILYYRHKMFSVEIHVAVNCPNALLFSVICQMIKHTATYSQHTQRTAGPIRDQTTIECTIDEDSLSIIFKKLLMHGNTLY